MQLAPEAKEDEHKADPLLTLYRYGKVGPANGEILKQSTRKKQRNVLNIVQSIEPTKKYFSDSLCKSHQRTVL